MKSKIIIYICILLSVMGGYSCKKHSPKITIYIAGDSTAQTYHQKDGLIRGWGQMLPLYLDSNIIVSNHAMGGRSSKTFLSEGRWDTIMSHVQPGDYVMIQFGHNDASTRPERHATLQGFKLNIEQMVKETRSKGASPILLTSIVMRTFKDHALIDDRLKAYPALIRIVAQEQQVPLIDLNTKTRDFILLLGDSASIPYYRWVEAGVDCAKPQGIKDDTHMLAKGATHVAFYVAEALSHLGLKDLSNHVEIKSIPDSISIVGDSVFVTSPEN